MSSLHTVGTTLQHAQRVAADAATAARCEVRELTGLDQLRTASTVLDKVWERGDGSPIVPFDILRVLSHTRNYAAGAFRSGVMIGAIVAFRGEDANGLLLHSHVAGMLPEMQTTGGGYAMKLHQRVWALEHGLDAIEWTFDPLVRRNAYFNLTKLGATGVAYHKDFYGTMADGINGTDASDRLLVSWKLNEVERTAQASNAGSATPSPAETPVLLDATEAEEPRVQQARGRHLRCRLPRDIVALRRNQPRLAAGWRRALRECLEPRMAAGYRALSVTRDGWLILGNNSQPSA